MNKAIGYCVTPGVLALFIMVFCLVLLPLRVQAQAAGDLGAAEKFSREELAQMLGPIALYPDKLLSQILMASTYPIEVIEADRWVKKNPGLPVDTLDRRLLDKDWDPSVKAICHFPAILSLMSERITETTDLGNAFLAQEAEVMDVVQELRASAYAQGNLVTTSQQKVLVEKETIIIEPANPSVVYVPYYDPFYIYGPWWYPAYPPYYWGPVGVRVSLGFGFGYWPGVYFGFSWGNWSYINWPSRSVYIHVHERPRYVRHDRWWSASGRWVHSPVHRRGIAYADPYIAAKYSRYPQRTTYSRGTVQELTVQQTWERSRNLHSGALPRVDQNQRVPERPRSRVEYSRQEQQRVEKELRQRQQQTVRQPVAGSGRQQQKSITERSRQQQTEPAGRILHRRQQLQPPVQGSQSPPALKRNPPEQQRGGQVRNPVERKTPGPERAEQGPRTLTPAEQSQGGQDLAPGRSPLSDQPGVAIPPGYYRRAPEAAEGGQANGRGQGEGRKSERRRVD